MDASPKTEEHTQVFTQDLIPFVILPAPDINKLAARFRYDP